MLRPPRKDIELFLVAMVFFRRFAREANVLIGELQKMAFDYMRRTSSI